ncbi:putative Cyclin-dependent kinase 5 activator 1 [Hypsibius exemplaris]|uniref:Cyclin-dependent kinase 5 activator 1 n=1 Tax=Hypsibius exemplaris TaxID=2072580 RepID=A0A1W0X5H5_HYPEX|nr:putative Cyclin-dependent kinase 5 activator 1 [Hypsibius exemplaris]
MGASWSGIVTPTNDPDIHIHHYGKYRGLSPHFKIAYPGTAAAAAAATFHTVDPNTNNTTTTTKSMFAQHLHLMNTLTLKKLISSGTLSRPKKASKEGGGGGFPALVKAATQDLGVGVTPSDILVGSNQQQQQRKASFAQLLPRTTIVDVIEQQTTENGLQKSDLSENDIPPRLMVKRTVLQASTSELLRCFGTFLHVRFRNLAADFSPHDPMLWLRGLDRNLIAQGWQDIGFINPANIVFLYLLLRGLKMDHARSIRQLQAQVLTALYLAYSYMGHEISYPVKLFLYADDSKDDFWKRCLRLIDAHSEDMLKLNSDSAFFAKIFAELKSHGATKPVQYHF